MEQVCLLNLLEMEREILREIDFTQRQIEHFKRAQKTMTDSGMCESCERFIETYEKDIPKHSLELLEVRQQIKAYFTDVLCIKVEGTN